MSRSDVAVVIVRDPDGDTQVQVFIDGVETDFSTFEVDAGRGMDVEDWNEHRDWCIKHAREWHGEDVEEAVKAAFADPPGSQYINGWDEENQA